LNPSRFTVFSTDCVSGVKNINTCVLDFFVMPVVCSHWLHAGCMVFHLWISPGFIIEHCI
jgi:hypothetical protein